MTEINNNLTSQGLSLQQPQQETITGEAQLNATKAEAAVSETTTKDTISLSERAKRLNEVMLNAVETAGKLPVVDVKKVEAIQEKIRTGQLDILSDNPEIRLQAASRIATSLIKQEQELGS